MGFDSIELVAASAGMLVALAPIVLLLTIVVGLELTSRFRKSVERSIKATSGASLDFKLPGPGIEDAASSLHVQWVEANRENASSFHGSYLQEEIRRRIRSTSFNYFLASGAFVLVLTCGLMLESGLAASQDSILGVGLLFVRFFLINATPLVLATTLVLKKQLRFAFLGVAVLLASLWVWVLFIPDLEPFDLWLLYAGAPTTVALVLGIRRQRAIGPMIFAAIMIPVYGFATSQIYTTAYVLEIIGPIGFLHGDLAQLSFADAGTRIWSEVGDIPIGDSLAIALAFVNSPLDYIRVENAQAYTTELKLLQSGIGIAALILGVAAGTGLVSWFARRYKKRKSSDQMIAIDVLMVIFTIWLFLVFINLWDVSAGAWVLGGFACYSLLTRWNFRWHLPFASRPVPSTLLFLRVFGFDNRTQRLLEDLGQYWRYAGPVRLIAGTDVVHNNIEPHEFLEFLNRRLARSFVKDYEDLKGRLAEGTSTPDPDGLFRVEEFFCHDDTWRMTVSHLARSVNAIFMDLRGFGPRKRGCIFEIEQLVATVPVGRILLLADDSTDADFLEQTLDTAWHAMPADSPNCSTRDQVLRVLRASSNHGRTLDTLLGLLCTGNVDKPLTTDHNRYSLLFG